jgi:hypothetical protein
MNKLVMISVLHAFESHGFNLFGERVHVSTCLSAEILGKNDVNHQGVIMNLPSVPMRQPRYDMVKLWVRQH